jgi:hypothetical protein
MPLVAHAVRLRCAVRNTDCEHVRAVSDWDWRGLERETILNTRHDPRIIGKQHLLRIGNVDAERSIRIGRSRWLVLIVAFLRNAHQQDPATRVGEHTGVEQ